MAISGSVWDSAIINLQVISERLKQEIFQNSTAPQQLTSNEWLELNLLIKNPIELYDYHAKIETERRNEFSFLLSKLAVAQQIVVFGSGYLENSFRFCLN